MSVLASNDAFFLEGKRYFRRKEINMATYYWIKEPNLWMILI
jgi:maltoporin